MNTLDKINSELSLLQEELSQLKHYTEEIGKAKDASTTVVNASKEFLSSGSYCPISSMNAPE